MNAYFEFGLKIRVKDDEPTLKRKLKNWEKQDSTKKAAVRSFITFMALHDSQLLQTFTREQIETFLRDAPHSNGSIMNQKIALLLGVFGLLRINELCNVQWSDVKRKDDIYVIEILRYYTVYTQLL